jgi:hypothetical protein
MAKKRMTTTAPKNNNVRAKFGYLNYEDMLLKISEGQIDQYDIVFGKDTKEVYIISEDLEPKAMHSKVYVFESVTDALEKLNTATDTYAGQIVSILSQDVYVGHIVNKESDGKFSVKPLHESSEALDYDTLGNRPIENKMGTFETPVILSTLDTGVYNIFGKYKITTDDETEYLTGERRLVLVHNMGATTTIKVVTADGIMDFIISNDEIIRDKYLTLNYLNEHGYTTEEYVNERIKELDLISRTELDDYVKDYIDNVLEEMIEEKLDNALSKKFQDIPDSEIYELFDIDYEDPEEPGVEPDPPIEEGLEENQDPTDSENTIE